MPGYRVTFFKELLSSDGHPFNCVQQQVEVPHAKNAELAVDSAIRRLESLRGVPDWTFVADSFAVEAMVRGRDRWPRDGATTGTLPIRRCSHARGGLPDAALVSVARCAHVARSPWRSQASVIRAENPRRPMSDRN